MPQTIVIHITVRSVLLVLAALLALWLIAHLSQIMLILFLATLLAVAIRPMVDRLVERRISRPAAILLIYLVLLGIVGLAVGILVPVLVVEVSQLGTTLPKVTQQLLDGPRFWLASHIPSLGRALSSNNFSEHLGEQLGTYAGGIGGLLVEFGKTLTSVAIGILAVLIVGFFLTSDADLTPRLIARLLPARHQPLALSLTQQIGRQLGHWVRAQLLVGVIYGVTFGIGLALLGVPYSLALGVAAAILELIPYLGGAIVTVVAMLIAVSISPWLALGVLILELVIASIQSHVVYPKLVGDIVGLHPLVVLIALFVGAEAWGVMGALLAVPAAVVLQVLFDQFYRFDTAPAPAPAVEEPAPTQPPAPATSRAHSR